jgi:DNA-binding NarL/FixJ family response regulator
MTANEGLNMSKTSLPQLRAWPPAAQAKRAAVRVLLVEGERLVRAGLRQLLEAGSDIAVAAETASGQEAITLTSEVQPDVVLMNIRLPDIDGLEATRRITARPERSRARVLILSDNEREEGLFAALRAGASGLLSTNTEPAELLRAIRVLAGGDIQLSPSATRRLIDTFATRPFPQRSPPKRFEELTAREREVVALVAQGLTNREIADQLVVSPATVKTHVGRAMVKLDVHDRAKLVALAYQTGFARPSGERIPDGDADPPLVVNITEERHPEGPRW